jgi:hypothetical protein
LKRIVIITSGQPSGNPRMTKEAIALHMAGYEVTVIFCPMSPWGDDFDKELFIEYSKINWICVGAHPIRNKFKYLYTRIRRKIWEIIYKTIGNRFDSAIRASCLFSQDLEREARKHLADLYIGHNLGSIKAVIQCAQKFHGLASFDFEDFHRGEEIENSIHWNLVSKIEDKFIPKIQMSTAASPLIGIQYAKLYNSLKPLIVLNVFKKRDNFEFIESSTSVLKIIWFSQNIGLGRGLESLIRAIGLIGEINIEMTLLGNCSKDVELYLNELGEISGLKKNQIKFLKACDLEGVFRICSEHHIGICSENPKTTNRDVCLTNKLFTYLSARNALLLTKTKAQNDFLDKYTNVGYNYAPENHVELSELIRKYYFNRDILEEHRNNSFRLAQTEMNWEMESSKLVEFYKESLN